MKKILMLAAWAISLTFEGCGCGGEGGAPEAVAPDSWTRIPGEVGSTLLLVPSSAMPGGVPVHMSWPKEPTGARFREGAPVVVEVPGGSGPGALPPAGTAAYADFGFVYVVMTLPNDTRGIDSIRAFTDVVRFAGGQIADVTGKRIGEYVGYAVLTNNIGVLGTSHGGNLATAAFSIFGSEMTGVSWFVGWETPVTDQHITKELGGPSYLSRGGVGTTCPVDYANLRLSTVRWTVKDAAKQGEELATRFAYFDGNGNGSFDFSDPNPQEATYDPSVNEPLYGDHPVKPYVARAFPGGPLKAFYSVEMTQALGSVPPELADPYQSQQFWTDRQAANHWGGAILCLPSLAVMVLGTEVDHAQTIPDHSHIKMQYEGWLLAGAGFVRLNPDAAYVAQAGGTTSVDNPAFQSTSWETLLASLEPESVEGRLFVAAVEEMADRVQSGNWSANLDSTLGY